MKWKVLDGVTLAFAATTAALLVFFNVENSRLRQDSIRHLGEIGRLHQFLKTMNLRAAQHHFSATSVPTSVTASPTNPELLRLRGQVGLARQQLADNQQYISTLQTHPDESLARAAEWGDTGKVLTAVEAVALRHLSTASKTKMLKDAMSALMELARTNATGLWIHPSQVSPELRVPLQSLAQEEGFEILCQGPLQNLQNLAQTVVVRQREPERWPDGSFSRVYAFADGHVEIHKTADGKFDDWESERMVVPAK